MSSAKNLTNLLIKLQSTTKHSNDAETDSDRDHEKMMRMKLPWMTWPTYQLGSEGPAEWMTKTTAGITQEVPVQGSDPFVEYATVQESNRTYHN